MIRSASIATSEIAFASRRTQAIDEVCFGCRRKCRDVHGAYRGGILSLLGTNRHVGR
jgi:hypothetical protein